MTRKPQNQFKLLGKRRFLPLFLTQFLGAFNDNVYKNALIILLTYQLAQFQTAWSSVVLINLSAALFILPFALFSATAGQLVDAVEKSRYIRIIKLCEIAIAIFIGIAFYSHNIYLIMLGLFLFGAQSTFFGPVKYSILPQHLKSYELVGGNGLIETATFIAIIAGSIVGGILIVEHRGALWVWFACTAIAILGWSISRAIPRANSYYPQSKVDYNIIRSTWQTLRLGYSNQTVFLAILGISWFWFLGSALFYQLPIYIRDYLAGNSYIVNLCIACFSIGIGIGALLCEKLSRHNIEIGLVPLASLILTLLTTQLYHIQPDPTALAQTGSTLTFANFFQIPQNWVVLGCIIGLGIASGLYTVPLYAFIQDRSPKDQRAQLIACNNIINAIFMALAAVVCIGLLTLGLSVTQLFLVMATLNLCITLYIFTLAPEFITRLLIWLFVNTIYRLQVKGTDNLPDKGGVIYACNHVSYVDVLIMTAVSRRPIRFFMHYKLFETPILSTISKMGKAIPIASAKEDPDKKEQAFEQAKQALADGDIIGIFPEGSITYDGELGEFKRGVENLAQAAQARVVPMAINGLWGSFFSREQGTAMTGWPKKLWAKIKLNIGQPIDPDQASADYVRQQVAKLLEDD